MTTYTIYSESGQELTAGIRSEAEARDTAQALANEMQATVYLDTVPTSTDPDDDEDCGEAIEPEDR